MASVLLGTFPAGESGLRVRAAGNAILGSSQDGEVATGQGIGGLFGKNGLLEDHANGNIM